MKFTFAAATPMTRTRRLALATPPDASAVGQIRERLQAVDGIKWLEAEPGEPRLRMGYDTAFIGFDAVAEEVERTGVRLERRGRYRLRSTWYRFVDGNARPSNPPACCGNPPPGATRKRP